MVRELKSADSLKKLKNGFVLNLPARGAQIHPMDCWHVQRMTVPPRKIWAPTIEELEQWAKEQCLELDSFHPHCPYLGPRRSGGLKHTGRWVQNNS